MDERACVLCGTAVGLAEEGARSVCPRCTERLVDRWSDDSDGLTLGAWLARHDLSALCVFWQSIPDGAIRSTRCDTCTGVQARHCNLPMPPDDPQAIIPGWCGAHGCCCDGNLLVVRRYPADSGHSACATYRRRVELRGTRIDFLTR